MKKALSLILALVICFSMCACGEKDSRIDTEQEAISALKSDERAIENGFLASYLGFHFYKDPVFTVCTAEKIDDNTWAVTLKGNISGYTDEYKQKYDSCGFVFKANVSVDGEISARDYRRVD